MAPRTSARHHSSLNLPFSHATSSRTLAGTMRGDGYRVDLLAGQAPVLQQRQDGPSAQVFVGHIARQHGDAETVAGGVQQHGQVVRAQPFPHRNGQGLRAAAGEMPDGVALRGAVDQRLVIGQRFGPEGRAAPFQAPDATTTQGLLPR